MKPNWFIGFVVPADDWYRNLPSLHPGCRGFHQNDLHMTLAFLGPVGTERAQTMIPLLQSIDEPRFTIELGGLIPLPKPKRFSALSFELSQGRQIAANMIGRWRDPFLNAAGAPPDNRPPLPHITIARPKGKNRSDREEILAWAQGVTPPEASIEIKEVALYTWSEDRRERQFQIVASHPLNEIQ